MKKDSNYDTKKSNFITMLLSMDKDQISDFIKDKGREPKKIRPFVYLR
jgi:hypothetical protein